MLPGYLPAAGCPRDRVALAAVDGQTGVRRQEGNAMTVRLRRLQHFNFITGGSHHLSLSHLCVRWKPLKTSSTLRFLPPPPPPSLSPPLFLSLPPSLLRKHSSLLCPYFATGGRGKTRGRERRGRKGGGWGGGGRKGRVGGV